MGFVKRMKILAGLLASSLALPEKNAFPRKKNSQFCDISSVKGTSCDDIFRKDPTAHDGIYKIQVSGNPATIVECKFEKTPQSGGQWSKNDVTDQLILTKIGMPTVWD